MTIQEFKSAHNLAALSFFKSNDSDRLVASCYINGVENRVISRSDFDQKKPIFVYKNNILSDKETGEVVENLYWMGNKAAKAVLTL